MYSTSCPATTGIVSSSATTLNWINGRKWTDGLKKKKTILMTASASMVYFIVLFFLFPSVLGKQADDKLFL